MAGVEPTLDVLETPAPSSIIDDANLISKVRAKTALFFSTDPLGMEFSRA